MELPGAMIAACALGHAGLSALCLAMDRHHQQVLKRRSPAVWTKGLRGIGWLLLALSGVYCVIAWGAGIGAVAWFGIVSVSVLVLAVLLPYKPRAVLRGAVAAGAVGLAMMIGVAL